MVKETGFDLIHSWFGKVTKEPAGEQLFPDFSSMPEHSTEQIHVLGPLHWFSPRCLLPILATIHLSSPCCCNMI